MAEPNTNSIEVPGIRIAGSHIFLSIPDDASANQVRLRADRFSGFLLEKGVEEIVKREKAEIDG